MIRTSAPRGTKTGAIEPSASRPAWRKGSLCVLFCAAALLLSVPASAADERTDRRAAHRVERVERHQSKRREVPHNARYKNPPREDRRHRDRQDHARRYDRHRGKHGDRHHYGKPHHHDHHKRHYRTHVYHHYEYVPYYAPVVVAYPYYCDLCHSGFYAEHLFHDHLCDVHHLTHALIPGLLYWYGGTFYFRGW